MGACFGAGRNRSVGACVCFVCAVLLSLFSKIYVEILQSHIEVSTNNCGFSSAKSRASSANPL